MLVGALADAGADQSAIAAAVASMNAGATVSFEKVKRAGIAATKYHVHTGEQKAHRHLSHIVKMIEAAELTSRARANSIAVFRRLGEAEASVHSVPIEKVHFHEVGAADSIADIVGACVALDNLGVDSLACSAVNVGSGTVNTEHGVLPVPAPATAALLEGRPVYARGPAMELTTPTGAAIATTLASDFGPMPPMRIAATGYGAGDSDFAEHANVLRAIIGESSGATESTTVSIIEANIDDSTPELLGHAMTRLLEAGALDVTLAPVQMKKNRPGVLLSVIAVPECQEELARLVLEETTTLGLRLYQAERRVQARQFVSVDTGYGTVRVKVTDTGFAPEFEDCRKLASETGKPLKKVLADVHLAYWKQAE